MVGELRLAVHEDDVDRLIEATQTTPLRLVPPQRVRGQPCCREGTDEVPCQLVRALDPDGRLEPQYSAGRDLRKRGRSGRVRVDGRRAVRIHADVRRCVPRRRCGRRQRGRRRLGAEPAAQRAVGAAVRTVVAVGAYCRAAVIKVAAATEPVVLSVGVAAPRDRAAGLVDYSCQALRLARAARANRAAHEAGELLVAALVEVVVAALGVRRACRLALVKGRG